MIAISKNIQFVSTFRAALPPKISAKISAKVSAMCRGRMRGREQKQAMISLQRMADKRFFRD